MFYLGNERSEVTPSCSGPASSSEVDQQVHLQGMYRLAGRLPQSDSSSLQFGGNPDHVTLYGESAGAGSLLQHVVANGGKTSPQLFKGIIASSVFTPPQYSATDYVVQVRSDLALNAGADLRVFPGLLRQLREGRWMLFVLKQSPVPAQRKRRHPCSSRLQRSSRSWLRV